MDLDKLTKLLELLRDVATGPAGLAVFAALVATFLGALYWRHEARQTAAMERIALEIESHDRPADVREDTGQHRVGEGGRR